MTTPDPYGAEDPTCLACGGYFTDERPHRARGLHRACYLRAWHAFDLDRYPLTYKVKPRNERSPLTFKSPRQSRRRVGDDICRDCLVALHVEVGSLLWGRSQAYNPCGHTRAVVTP